MRSLYLLTGISVVMLSSSAWAGFEWQPPVNNPAPTQDVMQQPHYKHGGPQPSGFPAPTVQAEPLGMGSNAHPRTSRMEPISSMPQSNKTFKQASTPALSPVPVRQIKNISGGGLVIDPYPLQNLNTVATPVKLTEESVKTAMAEEAKVLNPVRLGAGMTTGVKPEVNRMELAMKSDRRNTIPNAHGGSFGMTPMMGGEPIPLTVPNSAKMQKQGQQYGEVIGFGRDVPMTLALSQIVPEGYSLDYIGGIDTSKNVSWQGGKPWNQSLNDMLRAENLTSNIQGNRVIISRMGRG